MLILFVLSSAYSVQQFSSSTDSFRKLGAVAVEAALIMGISADLAELQLDILHYSNARHASAVNRINASLMKLGADLDGVANSVTDEERSATIQKMLQTYSNYAANIESMRESKELERKLTEKELPELYDRIFEHLSLNEKQAELNANAELVDRLQLIQEHLLESEIHMISFQVYRRYEDQVQALKDLRAAGNLVENTVIHVPMSAEGEASLSLLHEGIQDYDVVFRQAIQAIRGSLFLVNVVMAGEAEEFSTLASQLRESTVSIQNALTVSVNSELDSASRTTAAVTLGAILLGILLSLSLSQSILLPIKEISTVFQRLSRGDVEGTIPGLERKDEIGVLAASATVFKNVSMRTTLLLEESEQLTSELQVREKELQIKTQELEKSVDQMNNFAYVASHDLKSPLRAIDNLAKWVVEDCADILPAESSSHLDLLQQRISLMETLLDDLLLYSRVGKVEEQLELVSVTALLEQVKMLSDISDNYELRWPQSDISLTTLVVSLRQVFLNLFSNAFKYANSDQGVLTIDWHEDDGEFVTFSVADNGPGISPQYHRKIFEMFQTLSTKDVFGGSGMGLAIVKKVIEGVGGGIAIESDEGKGAKFIFTWPKDCAKTIES